MNPLAMILLVGGLHVTFAWSAWRRLSLLAQGAPEDRTDNLWERLTAAPGDRGPSALGAALIFTVLVGAAVAPAAFLGGLAAPGAAGRGFTLLGAIAAGLAGGAGVAWAVRAQIKMPKYASAGAAHVGIFIGFATLLARTIILVGRGFDERFSLWVLDPHSPDAAFAAMGFGYNVLKDIVVFTVIAGVVTFIRFRMQKLKRLAYGWHAWVVLGVIATMMLSDVLYDGGSMAADAIRAGGDTSANIAHIAGVTGENLGRLVALVIAAVTTNADTAHAIGAVGFWTHVALVFLFLNYLPYGKHFHVITSLPNVVLRDLDPPGRLKPVAASSDALMEQLGAAMELPDFTAAPIGVGQLAHFSWKSLLDFYTCTECGRCSDNCPAHRTGKLLSPKHLTIDLRDAVYAKQDEVFERNGFNTPEDAPAPLAVGVVPEVIHPDVIWACTTCRACEEQCPVMITYVDKIVDMRRNLVMLRGEFPAELQKTFSALETNGNPWNITRMERAEWSDGLDVPLMSDKPDAEVLYWVGCAASYDDRAKKIARATVKILREANIDFAILGSEETCTGDPARRAGNEHLFMMLAEQNAATLNTYKPRKILTTCPHCFNALANEYPDFGAKFEVVHHTDYLLGLLTEGKIKATKGVKAKIAYHDSCYLGRYNGVYEQPREVLKRIPGVELVEAEWNREKGLCCGAGGAQMWMEEQHSAERVNNRRTLQLVNTGASVIASGCPFCQTMLTDGLKNMEDTLKSPVEQLDVAELLERAVEFRAKPAAAEVSAEA
ncbi:MAG: (Fe-S)-binding protein [Polyangiales bacterium]